MASSSDPDASLVARIAKGDQRAARTLVARRLPQMTALAYRMLGDAAEAEDVAQEVFLRVWRSAGEWRQGQAKFSTWMSRVAINLCYDRLRKKREHLTETPPEQVDEGPSAFDALHGQDVSVRVAAAVDALPPRQRAAIALCHYQDMSNIEAAAVLETTVEAVEGLLGRARRALRAALAADAAALLESTDGARG